MINGNDGGATVTFNGGKSWSTILNQPTAQLYHVAVDNQMPYRVYAAQQDNTTISVPSRSDHGRITIEEWETVGGGEDGYIAPHPTDPNIVYAADHHWLHRYDRRTKQVRDISPNPETHYGWGAADINYRFWWTYPGDGVAARSEDALRHLADGAPHAQRGPELGGDQPRPDPRRSQDAREDAVLPEARRPANSGARSRARPTARSGTRRSSPSPSRRSRRACCGRAPTTATCRCRATTAASWTKVTPPDLPEFALISIIDPSPHDPATAYVAATRYKLQDNRPYLYKTSDYGATWTKIVDGIPGHDFTRVIREDPGRKGLLYAGTETGVYVSFDDGGRWQPLQLNLPVVPMHDLVVKDGDLVAATHGRSFWILDNVALLHQLTPAALTDAGASVPAANHRALRSRRVAGRRLRGGANIDGVNPPAGVVVPFYLKDEADRAGDAHDLEGGARAWRRADPHRHLRSGGTPRRAARADRSRGPAPTPTCGTCATRRPRCCPARCSRDAPSVPWRAPGTYTLELSANGVQTRTTATIVKDPRLTYTDAELEAQFAFLIDVRDKLTETMSVVKQVRDTRPTAEALVKKAKESRRGKNA